MTKEEIKIGISKIEDMFPYKEVGNKDSYSDYNQGWADACGQFSDLIDSLPEQGQWIDVKEKPHPDKPGKDRYEQIPCLVVFSDSHYPTIQQWNCEHKCWDDEDGDDYAGENSQAVTHWMPLPAPPITGKETEK